jgi:hypothetical protein
VHGQAQARAQVRRQAQAQALSDPEPRLRPPARREPVNTVTTQHEAPASHLADDEWNVRVRGETETERLDRNLAELLQELRVAQTGVQILFAFLLTLPFMQRFEDVTRFERGLYFGSLLSATLASLLLIAPVAYHRLVFRRHDKRRLVDTTHAMALAGLTFLALAVCGIVVLITHFLFGESAAIAVGAASAVVVLVLWYLLPLMRRQQVEDRRDV